MKRKLILTLLIFIQFLSIFNTIFFFVYTININSNVFLSMRKIPHAVGSYYQILLIFRCCGVVYKLYIKVFFMS